MNIHKITRLTPLSRERMVRMAADRRKPVEIATCVGISLKTVHDWIARFAAEAWLAFPTARRVRIGCIGRQRRR